MMTPAEIIETLQDAAASRGRPLCRDLSRADRTGRARCGHGDPFPDAGRRPLALAVSPGFEFAHFELAPPDWKPTPRVSRG
jgi:hypothetical protein